ncbi:uncharacterized protein [Littorina saxatilis]|uniref:uncharacterized protein isoform X1 n=1 Tax=Littorina saxatilis TaxID=31220 RepID=UPI0038B489AC
MKAIDEMKKFFGTTPAIGVMLLLGILDYLWGEHIFECPCSNNTSDRLTYSLSFLLIPPVAIISLDTQWILCFGSLCKCCSEGCCKALGGFLKRAVCVLTIWILFSWLEPKVDNCLNRTVSCNCTAEELETGCVTSNKENAAKSRVNVAFALLISTAVAVPIFLIVCALIVKLKKFAKCLQCCGLIDPEVCQQLEEQQKAERQREEIAARDARLAEELGQVINEKEQETTNDGVSGQHNAGVIPDISPEGREETNDCVSGQHNAGAIPDNPPEGIRESRL